MPVVFALSFSYSTRPLWYFPKTLLLIRQWEICLKLSLSAHIPCCKMVCVTKYHWLLSWSWQKFRSSTHGWQLFNLLATSEVNILRQDRNALVLIIIIIMIVIININILIVPSVVKITCVKAKLLLLWHIRCSSVKTLFIILPKDLRAVTYPGLSRKRLNTHFLVWRSVCWQFGWLCNAPVTYNCNRRTINPRMMMTMMIQSSSSSSSLSSCTFIVHN